MALAFPSFYTQKPKDRTRVSTKRIAKEFDPPKRCKGKLPFDKAVVTPIINGVAYAGYTDVSHFNKIVMWEEWELYDGLKAMHLMHNSFYIVSKTTQIRLDDSFGYGQLFVLLGRCGYNLKPDVPPEKSPIDLIRKAREYSLKWGKGWIIKHIKECCYQGRIMQTEEFMKVWEEALLTEKGV